jgi:hypothetical protein
MRQCLVAPSRLNSSVMIDNPERIAVETLKKDMRDIKWRAQCHEGERDKAE